MLNHSKLLYVTKQLNPRLQQTKPHSNSQARNTRNNNLSNIHLRHLRHNECAMAVVTKPIGKFDPHNAQHGGRTAIIVVNRTILPRFAVKLKRVTVHKDDYLLSQTPQTLQTWNRLWLSDMILPPTLIH